MHNITVQSPEIRKYKRKFNGEILCGALWGVNLLVGTDNGLLLLDRSGHGKGTWHSGVLKFIEVYWYKHSWFYLYLCLISFPTGVTKKIHSDWGTWRFKCFGLHMWWVLIRNFFVPLCYLLLLGRKNKLRVYYLSWLRNKILKGDDVSVFINVCEQC